MIDQERLKEILAEAAALSTPEGRATYLDTACGDDAELRAEVESLLAAHEGAGEFLAKSVLPPPEDPNDEGPGTVVGRYKLLEEIGEGTFGRVFVAEQTEPVRRKAALKIVKAGMDTREVIARFEAERQALALMDHPNIAKIHDASTTEAGRPFFVMELIHGIPVTDYCDQANLPMAARLEIFLQICNAVQHAHQKGVIHRDLKPSNILVTEIDGEPVPKIIDFGIAKALGQQLTEKTLYTAFQQVIGTPAYMSPEQTALSGTDVDTRSDIYSLGVLLYELLIGVTPIDTETLHRAGLEEVRRMIRETEPSKPSTRLRTLGAELAAVARHRQTEPAALARSVHGDLDWIVMRTLEKDRGRRYQSINALAEDLHHHLAHEPVAAGPPGTVYRLRKWARRHRVGALLTGTIATAAVFCIAALGIGMVGIKRERDRAVAAEERATSEAGISQAVNQFLLDDLLGQASPHSQPDRDVKLRTLVDRAAETAVERFREQPRVELRVRWTLGSVYRDLGELVAARAQLERMKELSEHLLLTDTDRSRRYVRDFEGSQLLKEGKPEKASSIYEEILTIRIRVQGAEHPSTLGSMSLLASVYSDRGKPAEAQKLFEQIRPIQHRVLGPEHPETLATLHNLAVAYSEQGMPVEAQELYEKIQPIQRRVLGSEHPYTLATMNNIAVAYLNQGKLAEAQARYEEVLPIQRRVLGPEHPETLRTLLNIAVVYFEQRKPEKAQEHYEDVIPSLCRVMGKEHPDTLWAIYGSALASWDQGKPAKAQKILEEILPIQHRVLGAEHPHTLLTMHNLAALKKKQDKQEDASEPDEE